MQNTHASQQSLRLLLNCARPYTCCRFESTLGSGWPLCQPQGDDFPHHFPTIDADMKKGAMTFVPTKAKAAKK
jgi:hypothetical protein